MKRFITPITFYSMLIIFIMMTNSKIYSQSPQLIYSTFIGGSGWDYGHAIAVDKEGYAYISGQANSTNYPTTAGALDRTANGSSDILITKLNKEGSTLVYSSYIGGSGRDDTRKVFVDKSGCVYLTGATASSNFPTTTNALSGNSGNYFLKLDSTGNHLEYSSRWGGGEKILVDSEGYLIVMGSTNSTSFPTTENAYSRTLAGGDDLYIAKIDITNNNVIFATLLGGDDREWAASFALDSDNNIIIAGSTSSSNFPITGNTFVEYTAGKSNVFVTKLKSDGTQLLYSTLIGGGDDEWSFDVICDDENNAYVTGVTKSSDFSVTASALDTSYNGGEDVFLTKLNPDCSELIYSTYIGGSSKDGGRGVVVGENGKAYLTGCTKSTDFPTTSDAYDTSFNGAGSDQWAWGDPFLLVMNTEGTQIEYSTYLGGSADEEAYGIAMDRNGGVYLCGVTSSSNFPTTEGAYDRTLNGGCNIYAVKFLFTPEESEIDYLGQTPPGNTPVVFAPGIIQGYVHGQIAISPDRDEIFWVINSTTERILYSKLEDGNWSTPAVANFVKDYLSVHNGGPVFSPDGNKIFFYSYRTGGLGNSDVWYVESTGSKWNDPINVGGPYNTTDIDPTPIFTNNGKAYRFDYKTEKLCYTYSNNVFSNPEPITVHPDYSPWWSIYISPEEDYLIFAGGSENADLFIRFKDGEDQWCEPIYMGNKINTTDNWERFPVVSPDGKYLFFTRGGSSVSNLFWVSTEIIDSLKYSMTGIGEDKKTRIYNFRLNQNYPNPFNPSTNIKYAITKPAHVKLTIYNLLGQEIRTLVNCFQNTGEYSLVWDSKNELNNYVPSGIYFYSLSTNEISIQKKMVLVR